MAGRTPGAGPDQLSAKRGACQAARPIARGRHDDLLRAALDEDRVFAAVIGSDELTDVWNIRYGAPGTKADLQARFDAVAADLSRLITNIGPDLATVTSDGAYVLQQLSSSLNLTLLNLERASQELADLIADIRANPSIFITGRDAE